MLSQTMFEVTGTGFDGGTDETDNRVVWVKATSYDAVRAVIDKAVYVNLSRLPDGTPEEGADYVLPWDEDKLIVFLNRCEVIPHDSEFENSYTHCGQSWEDHWSCAVNDDCPVCGKGDIEPYHSKNLLTGEVIIDVEGEESGDDDQRSGQ